MEICDIEILLELCKPESNLTKCADKFGKASSTITLHVQRIEKELGRTLLARHGSQVHLLQDIMDLQPKFQKIMNDYKLLLNSVNSYKPNIL